MLPRKFKRKNKKGMSPGSLIFTGQKKVEKIKISVFDYNADNYEDRTLTEEEVSKLTDFRVGKDVSWLNICGIHNTELIARIGKIFKIHALVLEDILNVSHNTKIDEFEDYIFIITKMINYNEAENLLNIEQVSFILGKNFLITFQEREGDVFDIIRDKIRSNNGRIRTSGADYLAYRLIDTIVDNYFLVLDKIDERIEDIEDELLDNPEQSTLQSIHSLRKEVIHLKRNVTPLRDILHALEREQYNFIDKSTQIYLRDLYDHIRQIIDTIDNYREVINGLQEVYLSSASNKMNEIVKVLTIISTIFIPLTFIVGIYGMNFRTDVSIWNMPELAWSYGYPFVMALMLMVVIGMTIFFKRKKWF
jgi:magnesium transporter